MIKAIINGVFKLVIGLVNLILAPIDLAISTALPGVSSALSMVSSFFNWISSFVSWVWSWLGFNSVITTLFIGYVVFRLTVPFTIHTVKLAIQWYDKLKV